ncbi:MAG TPA: class II fructose-bisphosphatase [Thermoleophilaceae bacterium]|nr:class II fructose-bisphosphatase [Thermoleophilaceae bacterium]
MAAARAEGSAASGAPAEVASAASPDRNLALELVRVTEYAALAAARWIGMGDKEAADRAAVDAMRVMLETVRMDGRVVIGEGEKDEAPMLYNGERIGDGSPPEADIAVDPLEGTELAATGAPRALAIIALGARDSMFDPGPCVYMEKMAASARYAGLLDLDRPLGETLRLIAREKGTDVRDVTVVMLDRPRHEDAIRAIREAGGRVRFIPHGDVSAALIAVTEDSPVDLLWGIGGTPEGVITAAAIKCIGGQMLGRLWPRDDDERRAAMDAGYDLDEILDVDRLVTGEDVFFAATGVTDGDVLEGVHYEAVGVTTESLVMRTRSRTVRKIHATHDRAKLREITGERAG